MPCCAGRGRCQHRGHRLLTGAGDRAFCSGMDLKEAARSGVGGGLIPGRRVLRITEVAVPQALLAARERGGQWAGPGLRFCLRLRLIVASETAVFGLASVARGMVLLPEGCSGMARGLRVRRAMEFILGGG